MADTIERMGKRKSATPNGTEQTPARGSGGTDTVRIASDLAEKLTLISIRRKVSVSDLLSPHVREWVEELYRQTVREMHSEIQGEK